MLDEALIAPTAKSVSRMITTRCMRPQRRSAEDEDHADPRGSAQGTAKNEMTKRIAVIVSRFVTGSAQSFNQQTNVDLSISISFSTYRS